MATTGSNAIAQAEAARRGSLNDLGNLLRNIIDTIDSLSDAEIAFLDGVTAGTVTASKAVVVDANKDIGDFRNVDVVNLDAGASGTAGTVDVFPTTAAKGKLAITAADSAGDTTTTIVNASQSGARTYTIPDAGASASFAMTEGAQTLNGVKTFGSVPVFPAGGLTAGATTITESEIGVLDSVTPGTVAASKAVVVDANKDAGDFRNLDAVNIDAGASGAAGTVDVFPTTALKGKIAIVAADSAGDTTTTITNASQAGARTYTIPDAGASASFAMTEGAQTLNGVKTFGSVPVFPAGGITAGATTITEAEIGVLDGVTPGTAAASKALVLSAGKQIDEIDISSAFKLGGSTVSANAGEINVLANVTPGTQAASKAVVADANVNTGVSKVTQLHIGASGSETQVTATAAEINALDLTTGAGTSEASKALVLDANSKLDGVPLIKRSLTALTNNQLQNLAATPVQVVNNPGGGKLIQVLSWRFRLIFVTTAIDDAAADGNLILKYATSSTIDTMEADGLVDASETAQGLSGNLTELLIAESSVTNKDVQISNDGAEFTVVGGGDSTAEVEVFYRLLDTDPA